MKLLVILVFLLVTACAAVGSKVAEHQSRCHDKHQQFIAMVDCLKANTSEMTEGRDGDLVRLYLAEAGLLSLKVENNLLDERIAWYELDKKLAFLQQQSNERDRLRIQGLGQGLQNAGAAMRPATPPPPTMMTCHFIGSTMTCF